MKPWQFIRSSMNRLGKSLPNRLLLVMIVTSLLIIVVLTHMVSKGFRNQWRLSVRPHLTQYLDYVNEDLGYPPDAARASELAQRLPINIYIESPDSSYSSSGKPLDIEDLEFYIDNHSRQRHLRRPRQGILAQENLSFGEHQDRTVLRNDLGEYQVYFEFAHQQKRPNHERIITQLLFGVLVIFGSCYLLIRRMLRPVQDIKYGVGLIGSGELSHRVPKRSDNDLGELATSINQMASDIEQMLDAKRQLLLGVSHELRSPLTRATIAVEMLESSANRERLRDDLTEMQQLITEILETERLNTPHSALNLSEVDPVELLNNAAFDAGGEIDVNLPNDLPTLKIDEPRMKLAVKNLIVNALRHGQSAAEKPSLKANLSADHQWLQIVVKDRGKGISPTHLPHIMEPFYRADPSRTRSTGGFGLGLYLCKKIVEAHHGKLSVTSQTGGNDNEQSGTRFEISIPVNNYLHQ